MSKSKKQSRLLLLFFGISSSLTVLTVTEQLRPHHVLRD